MQSVSVKLIVSNDKKKKIAKQVTRSYDCLMRWNVCKRSIKRKICRVSKSLFKLRKETFLVCLMVRRLALRQARKKRELQRQQRVRGRVSLTKSICRNISGWLQKPNVSYKRKSLLNKVMQIINNCARMMSSSASKKPLIKRKKFIEKSQRKRFL